MHSYLRGIGFSEIDSRIKLEKLLGVIIDEPTEKRTYKINEKNSN